MLVRLNSILHSGLTLNTGDRIGWMCLIKINDSCFCSADPLKAEPALFMKDSGFRLLYP